MVIQLSWINDAYGMRLKIIKMRLFRVLNECFDLSAFESEFISLKEIQLYAFERCTPANVFWSLYNR